MTIVYSSPGEDGLRALEFKIRQKWRRGHWRDFPLRIPQNFRQPDIVRSVSRNPDCFTMSDRELNK